MATVQTSEGAVRGARLRSVLDTEYYSFKGIPYAEPPLGDLRFKAPRPARAWAGVRDALAFGPRCMQLDPQGRAPTGSEDCLYLNVYTRGLTPPRPVMVWVHGGAGLVGSGDAHQFGPDFLLERDVVVVTFNYRLEVLGFLCLDSEHAPGNAGLKDGAAVLRWVRRNIAAFGGDPGNVTVFGNSAGASLCSYLLLSPACRGLFRRVALQSGVCSEAAFARGPHRARAAALARQLGKRNDSDDPAELFEFLKGVPAARLVDARTPLTLLEAGSSVRQTYWVAVEERRYGGEEPFLAEDWRAALRRGLAPGVELLLGYTAREADVLLAPPMRMDPLATHLQKADTFPELLAPAAVLAARPRAACLAAGAAVKRHYFGPRALTEHSLDAYTRLLSIKAFVFDIVQFAKFCLRSTDRVFLYKFTAVTERNVFGPFLTPPAVRRAGAAAVHGEDLMYLFWAEGFPVPVDRSAPSFKIIQYMTEFWTDFAKFGTPSPAWEPYSLGGQAYMELGAEPELRRAPEAADVAFFEGLLRRYWPLALAETNAETGAETDAETGAETGAETDAETDAEKDAQSDSKI